MMTRGRPTKRERADDRFTVSFAPGQRKTLGDIANLNHTTLAHVVRFALNYFIAEHRDKQIPLRFPSGDLG